MTSRSPTPGPITYVKVACHCGLNEFRAGFPTDQLPLSSDLCHCNSCRHASGQMAMYQVNACSLLCADSDEPFHADGSDGECPVPEGDGDLIGYRTSANAIRYFCSNCSAHLLFRWLGKAKEGGEREGAYWAVAAGALERTEGIVKVGYHIFVEDTLDGGLADHFRTVDGVPLPRYRRGLNTEELPLRWRAEALKQKPDSEDDDALHISCHCKSNEFTITRPNAESSLPHAAYPDLLHPHDITHLSKLRNSEDVKWWLRPLGSSQPTKYFAGHCACEYCRTTSGFEVQSWAYVPRANILDKEGKQLTLQPPSKDEVEEMRESLARVGVQPPATKGDDPKSEDDDERPRGIKQYISSPGRYREFCKTCGATVFAWQLGRPDLICVALGLVDETQDGARAEKWFDWCYTRVGFAEQALSQDVVEGMTASLKEAAEERKAAEATTHISNVVVDASGADQQSKSDIGVSSRRRKDGTVVTSVEEVTVAA